MTEILDTMTAPKFKSIDRWVSLGYLNRDLDALADELDNQRRDPALARMLRKAAASLAGRNPLIVQNML